MDVFHNVLFLLALTVGVRVSSCGSIPQPAEGHFVLKDVYNDVCLLLDVSAMFHVGYTKTDNTTSTVSFSLPADSSASGHCSHFDNDYHSHIDLRFNAGNAMESDGAFGLRLAFVRTRDMFWLANASIYYTLRPDVFPEAKNANEKVSSVLSGLQDFATSSSFYFPHSYKCDTEQVFTFTSPARPVSTLAIHTIHVQPFHVPTSGDFSKATACSDSKTTPSPPKTTKPYPTTTKDHSPTILPIGNITYITTIPSTTTEATAMPIDNGTTIPSTTTAATSTAIPIANMTTISSTSTSATATTMPIGNGTTIPPTTTSATTHRIGNVSTVPPPNTSTVPDITTIMTTPQPLTPPPEPPQGHFEVKDTEGRVCLLADMGLQFKIIYAKGDSETGAAILNLPTTANATGFCGSDRSNLTLTFHDDIFSVTFDFVRANDHFHVFRFDISYTEMPSMFPGTKNPNARRKVSNNTLYIFSADADKSYMCESDLDIAVTENVSILASQVQLQPFGVKSGQFSSAEECQEDLEKNTTVPIVIGVVLTAMVALVLVSYIVVRKIRGNNRRYSSVY
ncbi:Lysosome-associated membrane glycoprotein 1 [Branchiostoma belcheri]|nr:Lysosome-associated membrane glycoprotein 1 [Branchiostoma belcheri]